MKNYNRLHRHVNVMCSEEKEVHLGMSARCAYICVIVFPDPVGSAEPSFESKLFHLHRNFSGNGENEQIPLCNFKPSSSGSAPADL